MIFTKKSKTFTAHYFIKTLPLFKIANPTVDFSHVLRRLCAKINLTSCKNLPPKLTTVTVTLQFYQHSNGITSVVKLFVKKCQILIQERLEIRLRSNVEKKKRYIFDLITNSKYIVNVFAI